MSIRKYLQDHKFIVYAPAATAILIGGLYLTLPCSHDHKIAQTSQISTSTPEIQPAQSNISSQAAASVIANLKCPEDYKTGDEKVKAFTDFSDNYIITNPRALDNWKVLADGRADFLISHHCTATLVNFGYDGVSPIDAHIRQEIMTAMEVGHQ